MIGHDPIPPDALKARLRSLVSADHLTQKERIEFDVLATAYRAHRHAERAREAEKPYAGVDPRRHPPFACSACSEELRPRQLHGILTRGRILCDSCLSREDSPVLTLAADRAAAAAWLDQHGLIAPTPTEKE